MKTLRHIITFKCHKNCRYCINQEFKKRKSVTSLERINEEYENYARIGYENLIITGGEPVVVDNFAEILKLARSNFRGVGISTSYLPFVNRKWIYAQDKDVNLAPVDVVYSLHTDTVGEIMDLNITMKNSVYLAAMADAWRLFVTQRCHYSWDLAFSMIERIGFKGVTIRVRHPDGVALGKYELDQLEYGRVKHKDLSIRYQKREECLPGDYLLPNLDFERR
jgi:hypothetical protein